jgi:DNA-binding XRE family transcriptional regulator
LATALKTIHARAYRLLVDQLREARQKAGLTQRALAEILGRPYTFVAKYETHERLLDPIEYLELAVALDFDPCGPLRVCQPHVVLPRQKQSGAGTRRKVKRS